MTTAFNSELKHLKLNSMNSYMATGKHLLILGGCFPSINPQQWANEAPLFDIAETKVSKLAWDSQRWSKSQENMTRRDRIYIYCTGTLRPQLLCSFKDAHLTEEQTIFNKVMSAVRISVEWTFGKIISLFSIFLKLKNTSKLMDRHTA
jgi:hypothetical protein